jgi:hypothetical protein
VPLVYRSALVVSEIFLTAPACELELEVHIVMFGHREQRMQTAVDEGLQVTQCVTCGIPLATLLLGGSEPAREWECRSCGATYIASLDPLSPSERRDSIRMRHYFPEHREATSTLSSIVLKEERRAHPRRPMMVSVLAVELDSDLFPIGEDFTVISRNLSASGIAIVHSRPLAGRLAVLLELPKLGYVQLLLNIVRCKKIGSLYEMGGAFIERI